MTSSLVGSEMCIRDSCRPCVDCGLMTGRFCDWCLAADRLPGEVRAAGQMTPLCSHCDNLSLIHI
eukprot:8421035-Prorocentrum_lima.AAC.1